MEITKESKSKREKMIQFFKERKERKEYINKKAREGKIKELKQEGFSISYING